MFLEKGESAFPVVATAVSEGRSLGQNREDTHTANNKERPSLSKSSFKVFFTRCVPFHGENFSVEEFQALLLFEKNIMGEL